MRTAAQIGAAVGGGMGLAVGCVALALSWLLAAEAQSSDLLGAAEWAAGVTMLGFVVGGILGAVVGACVGAAKRVMRVAQNDKAGRERMKVA